MNVRPITLEGSIVRLEPLAETNIDDLRIAGDPPEIWRFLPYGEVNTRERMSQFVGDTIAKGLRGGELPFVVVLKESNKAVGMTRYMDIQPTNKGLEIGGTWYGVAQQRTGVNTECKRLLLGHAFEELGAIRVQLKTDARNERSQRAIERIGAKREGVLRENMILPDGYRRSTVYYSILENEWPEVKQRLDGMANRC